MPKAGGHAAHAVTEGDAIRTASPARRPLAGREDHDLPLGERDHLAAGLRAGALLDQEELAASEVLAGAAQQARHLEREGDLAVDVLVQAVVAAGLVAQQE